MLFVQSNLSSLQQSLQTEELASRDLKVRLAAAENVPAPVDKSKGWRQNYSVFCAFEHSNSR